MSVLGRRWQAGVRKLEGPHLKDKVKQGFPYKEVPSPQLNRNHLFSPVQHMLVTGAHKSAELFRKPVPVKTYLPLQVVFLLLSKTTAEIIMRGQLSTQ